MYVDRWTHALLLAAFCDAGAGLWLLQSVSERVPMLTVTEVGRDIYGLCALDWDQLKFGGSRSLVLRFLVCCLAVVCFCLLRPGLTVLKLSPVSSCRSVHSERILQLSSSQLCTVTVYIACGTMASGDAGVVSRAMTIVGSIFVTNC